MVLAGERADKTPAVHSEEAALATPRHTEGGGALIGGQETPGCGRGPPRSDRREASHQLGGEAGGSQEADGGRWAVDVDHTEGGPGRQLDHSLPVSPTQPRIGLVLALNASIREPYQVLGLAEKLLILDNSLQGEREAREQDLQLGSSVHVHAGRRMRPRHARPDGEVCAALHAVGVALHPLRADRLAAAPRVSLRRLQSRINPQWLPKGFHF